MLHLHQMLTLSKLRIPLLTVVGLALAAGLVAIPLSHGNGQLRWIPSLLLITCAALVALYHRGNGRKMLVALATVSAAGFAISAIGTSTGSIFGSYCFGDALGPKLFGTPLLTAIVWAMATYMAFLSTSMLPLNNRRLTASAGLMVLFDIMLEPTAARLGMWQFANNDVPFQNYVVWFLLGMLFLQVIRRSRASFSNSVAVPLFVMLMVFFMLLNIIFIAIRA